MISNIYWINEDKIGERKFGTMAKPRAHEWLEDEIKLLKSKNVDFLVSLLEKSEEFELGLEREKYYCDKWKIEFINFPIKDFNVPNDIDKFISLVEELFSKINENKKGVIHCRMGIGRSSTLASAILIKFGYASKEAFEIISKHRKLKVPDTEEQKQWIKSIEKRLW